MRKLLISATLASLALPATANAADTFVTGPVFTEFGPVTSVETDMAIPEGTEFRIEFDMKQPADEGQPNRKLESMARFINMHVAAGVPEENIHLAVVVHGKASFDLLSDAAWGKGHDGAANPSSAMLTQLMEHGVRVILCGQAAARLGIAKEDLVPGVEMALSAMTAHALLQQQGYTLNP